MVIRSDGWKDTFEGFFLCQEILGLVENSQEMHRLILVPGGGRRRRRGERGEGKGERRMEREREDSRSYRGSRDSRDSRDSSGVGATILINNSRPGRPPKRAPVGLSLAASQLAGHPALKKRMENGDYSGYENGSLTEATKKKESECHGMRDLPGEVQRTAFRVLVLALVLALAPVPAPTAVPTLKALLLFQIAYCAFPHSPPPPNPFCCRYSTKL
ncbi:hypothetical protein RUM43_009657 [Polyplax serrata]|uniref:Uncharacterized protein n=1 Tax=Polyplax serrata TaxID=468196 RepID=A0AAN8P768_POLSC